VSLERPGDSELPLRQRKKLQAKRRIKATALRLVAESAYDDVTVEQIAANSSVSPSTVYRYFQTKEGIFLWDEYDEAVIEEFKTRVREVDPIEAMTEAMAGLFSRRLDPEVDQVALDYWTMIDRVPQLKQSLAVQVDEMRRLLTASVTEAGWTPLESSVFAGAMVGTFVGALEAWVAEGTSEPLSSVLDRATRMVAEGFDVVFHRVGDPKPPTT
jgi:AcrR family transcriptional regulator